MATSARRRSQRLITGCTACSTGLAVQRGFRSRAEYRRVAPGDPPQWLNSHSTEKVTAENRDFAAILVIAQDVQDEEPTSSSTRIVAALSD